MLAANNKKKIINQAQCLNFLNISCDDIRCLADKVETGDCTNKESYAARMYFKKLFGDFKRNDDDSVNSALNYGYTIIRGAIARSVVKYGFIPSIGIHHCNELNNYNLADDFIEPFRALVDMWVAKNMIDQKTFTKDHRYSLVNILNYSILINRNKYSVLQAIDIMIASFSSCSKEQNSGNLLLPSIINIEADVHG